MLKQSLIIFLASTIVTACGVNAAQAEPPSTLASGEFKPGSAFAFSDKTKLLAKPESNAPTAATVAAGSALQIVKRIDKLVKSSELSDYFYEVKSPAIKGSAYVWGADLAKASAHLSKSEKDLLLIGIRLHAAGGVEKDAVAEIVRDGRLVSQCQFHAIESPDSAWFKYSLSAKILPPTGLSGNPQLASVHFSYDACDYAFGDALLLITAGKVTHVLDAVSMIDDAQAAESKFVFPNDKGGVKDRLILVRKDSLQGKPKSAKTSRQTYKWSGSAFAKIPATRKQ
jgi:hypothetical protein